MKKYNIHLLVLVIFLMLKTNNIGNSLLANTTNEKNETIFAINVFAGDDTSICYNNALDLTQLGAYITGDVTDGIWFSYGDGSFLPNNTSGSELFSIATHYLPGSNDINAGFITLILVSDDPDGNGPLTEVSDEIIVTLTNQPAMACVGNVSLSLNNNCFEELEVTMLLTNPIQPFDQYIIYSYDEAGILIPDNVLTSEYIGQDVNFTVGHSCGAVSCSGSIIVLDKHIPNLICFNDTITCEQSYDVLTIGLPIPTSASILSQSGNEFIIQDFDPCSNVVLAYNDNIQNYNCNNDFTQIITRYWQATDASNNSSNCIQTIYITRINITEITMPHDYNGVDLPAINCDQLIDTLANGAPSPIVTGKPEALGCNDIDIIYNDVIIPACGSTFKVIRKWFIFDNCTSEDRNHNQLIQIIDSIPPVIDCPIDTAIVSVSPYGCTASFQIEVPDYTDCSLASFELSYYPNFIGDTIPVNELFQQINIDNQGDSLYTINELPLGNTWVKYTMIDSCYNKAHCFRLVQIVDEIPPYIACDGFTTVSLLSDGTARLYAASIDDDSWDNCSDISFSVQKMTDICGSNPNGFNDYVDFCCEEIGTTIMVSLKVTDESGNYNICMVELTVDDKLEPEITAPTDITIACTKLYNPEDLSEFGTVVTDPDLVSDILIYDDINNGYVGTDGLATDNCDVNINENVNFDIECNQGLIIRTFTATDGQGLQAVATQKITIINPDPFDENDINWPNNHTYEGCYNVEIDSSDYPIYNNIYCGIIGANFEDQIFEIVPDACIKIIRRWTVIDWCQYESNTNTGIWQNEQIIKILNYNAPEIISSCTDTSYCLFESDCGSGIITLSMDAIDDCTPESELLYQWSITNEDDEVIADGNSRPAIIDINSGVYQINWLVEDLCGNITICKRDFSVSDCKAPTPNCYGNIVTTLMNESNQIEVWASDFNYYSYDNCTIDDDLIFSFSNVTSDQNRIFTCESLLNGIAQQFDIEMWVTDEYGNQDFCTVSLLVEDNQDNCEDQLTIGAIGGHVLNYNGNAVSDVAVDISCSIEEYSSDVLTDNNGQFIDADLIQGLSYSVRPSKDDGYLEGISALDLLLIQRHILKLKKFNNPYKMIAADVNKSEDINIVDLIHLRKLLLSKINTLPQNDSWRFVDKQYYFADTLQPWGFPESITISALESELLDVDFTGIKIGDVNFDYTSIRGTEIKENRSTISLTQDIIDIENNQFNLQLKLTDSVDIDAYQLVVEFDPTAYKFVSLGENGLNPHIENYNFNNIENGVIQFLWFDTNGSNGALLLADFIFEKINPEAENLSLSLNENYDNEIYIDENAYQVILMPFTISGIDKVNYEPDVNIYPNPIIDVLNIEMKGWKGINIIMDIYDINGHLVYRKTIQNQKRNVLNASVIPQSGSYIMQLRGEGQRKSIKFIKI